MLYEVITILFEIFKSRFDFMKNKIYFLVGNCFRFHGMGEKKKRIKKKTIRQIAAGFLIILAAVLVLLARITSYNVCYTKLLRYRCFSCRASAYDKRRWLIVDCFQR